MSGVGQGEFYRWNVWFKREIVMEMAMKGCKSTQTSATVEGSHGYGSSSVLFFCMFLSQFKWKCWHWCDFVSSPCLMSLVSTCPSRHCLTTGRQTMGKSLHRFITQTASRTDDSSTKQLLSYTFWFTNGFMLASVRALFSDRDQSCLMTFYMLILHVRSHVTCDPTLPHETVGGQSHLHSPHDLLEKLSLSVTVVSIHVLTPSTSCPVAPSTSECPFWYFLGLTPSCSLAFLQRSGCVFWLCFFSTFFKWDVVSNI